MRSRWLVRAISRTLALPLARSRHPFSSSSSGGEGGVVAVKQVTRSNFPSALEDLRALVRESDFVAIDLEMTGVTSAPWRDAFEFDRSDVRYLKIKDSAEKFAVVQFGVCPFRWDASKGSFLAHPHNFFIFPRKELPIDGPACEFLCQTTSLDFLARYQFDFNACIHEGISYLSRAQEAEAVCKLCSAYQVEAVDCSYSVNERMEVSLISTADLLFTERMKNKFDEWRLGILRSSDSGLVFGEKPVNTKTYFEPVFFKMRPAVVLGGFNSHQLKLIQLLVRKHFQDLVFVRGGEKRVVYTESDEDKVLLLKEVREDLHRSNEAKVKSAVGFRHVIDLLALESKLIVGHHCFLDIAHIYSKFFDRLPSSIVDFALSVNRSFPHIIDTKHLLNSSHVLQCLMRKSSKSLSSAYSVLCPRISSSSQTASFYSYVKVEVEAGETGSPSWNSGAKHEAGYDAFMTGCVFAQSCSHLGVKFETGSASPDLARHDKLQSYINLLCLSWNSGRVIDLRTGNETPDSSYKRKYPTMVFENIVLVWGFPSKLKPKDLKECICKVFGPDSVTSVFYLDPTAALVHFSKEEFVNDFLILKETLEQNDDPISVLHPLAKLLEGGKTCAANYDTYRDICSTPASKVLFAEQAEAAGIRWRTKVDSRVETEELTIADESKEEEPLIPVVKQVSRRKSYAEKQSPHQVSCEDILDSLYASKSFFVKGVSRA